jgi:hypothetical protein
MELMTIRGIEQQIFVMRDLKVMVDYDLARLYGVPTKALVQAVKRNPGRFPPDFVFRLTPSEKTELVTGCDRFRLLRHSSLPPFVFTREGVSMLSSVLKSERAVLVNVVIMRAFVRLGELLTTNKDLSKRLDELERKYEGRFKAIFRAIRALMEKPAPPSIQIKGFHPDK